MKTNLTTCRPQHNEEEITMNTQQTTDNTRAGLWIEPAMTKSVKKIDVKGREITVISKHGQDYISLTDMYESQGWWVFYLWLAEKQEYRRVFGYLGDGLQPRF